MEEEFKRIEAEQAWSKRYIDLTKKSRNHPTEHADMNKNSSLNRYLDVKPYDKSRVKLKSAHDALANDYINANFVTVPQAARHYILTQGPLPNTVGHFWLMAWEQKTTVIVMLNCIIEGDYIVKCEKYWPADDKILEFHQQHLKVTLSSVSKTKHYTSRKLLIEHTQTKETREITQFHYTAWPDHDQPGSPTSFLRLLTAVRQSGGLDRMDQPAIVHCSAGIGRSGTFCLIDSILCMVENQGSTEGVDVCNILLDMRDYRVGLIQTAQQLRFAFMAIMYGVKILEKANKLHPHISYKPQDQTHKSNGASQTNGKKSARGRAAKRPSVSNSSSMANVFNVHLLCDAMEDVDSDEADSLFSDMMKPLPNMKKPRNSSPVTAKSTRSGSDVSGTTLAPVNTNGNNLNSEDSTLSSNSLASKTQKLTNAIQSLLTKNTISTRSNADSPISAPGDTSPTQAVDSVLLRRRERELKNQRLAEKTMDIKQRMKLEEAKRENYARRMSILRRSAVYGGIAAFVLSSLALVFKRALLPEAL